MKEYKLTKTSKYSLFYLLSGLFMFFFIFAILNLSSFAQTGSFHGWYAQENVQNYAYIDWLQNFDSDDFKGLSNPCFDYDYSFTITHHAYNSDYNASSVTVNYIMHVVTSNGDMIIGSFLCPSLVDSASRTYTSSGTCFGIPSYSYLEVISSTDWARIAGAVEVSSWSFNVTPREYSSSFDYSDYSSFSPVNVLSSFYSNSDFGSIFYPQDSIYHFSFPLYSGTNIQSCGWVSFRCSSSSRYIYSFTFSCANFTDLNNCSLSVMDSNNNTLYFTPHLSWIGFDSDNNYLYYCYFDFTLDPDVYKIALFGSSTYPIIAPTYSFNVYKGTINDYMTYVQNQWSNISPNVTQTNSNIADSVSTVGSASTFESAQFDNFDNIVSSSGIDRFSLSFASAPLLWCGSLVTTCYNNLPSSIQYLFMAVGFVGILMLILNVFGRVVKRVGGDS